MAALHVVVRPLPERAPEPALAALHGLFDVVVDGINLTARLGEGQAVTLLAELGQLALDMSRNARTRGSIQLYARDAAWEVALERDAGDALLTVFRAGPAPELVVFEKRIPLVALAQAVASAIGELLESATGRPNHPGLNDQPIPVPVRKVLRHVAAALSSLAPEAAPPRRVLASEIRATATDSLSLTARASLRREDGFRGPDPVGLERADLHSLFCIGEIQLQLGSATLTAVGVQLYMLAEQLLQLAKDVALTARGSRPLLRRIKLGSIRLEVRRAPGQDQLDLRAESQGLAGLRAASSRVGWTAFVGAQTSFVGALQAAFVKADSAQAGNLRLRAVLDAARELDAEVLALSVDDSLTNAAPEGYRAFAPRERRLKKSPASLAARSMRFVPQWVASVPNIDLQATFLCGDRLITGSPHEVSCLDRQDGRLRWKLHAPPAASLVSPTGLLRLQPDGTVTSFDLDDGRERFSVRTSPRSGGGAAGSVVSSPGLPKIFALVEADSSVTAIDLVSGELRWRHRSKRSSNLRIRRSGKLLLVSGGDNALEALDVGTGQVVWRARGALPFTGEVGMGHQSAFVIAGCSGATWELLHLDACTGERLWAARIEDRPIHGRAPLVTPTAVIVTTRDGDEGGAAAFDRATGKLLWEHQPGLVSGTTAWLAVDDVVVANSASGVLLAIDAMTGSLRFNHVFSQERTADQPRRLEPVLRSGALFVPQSSVHVVRPSDGEILGNVPTDLVPDLVRVDERCSVYVAEESGHLAAFSTGPKLALVRS